MPLKNITDLYSKGIQLHSSLGIFYFLGQHSTALPTPVIIMIHFQLAQVEMYPLLSVSNLSCPIPSNMQKMLVLHFTDCTFFGLMLYANIPYL